MNQIARRHAIFPRSSAIGYTYDAGDTPFPSVEAFDEDTVLLLAQSEHIRWCNERFAAGWKHDTVRDDEKKLHPSLASWDELSLDERQKDIDAARNIIPLLGSIGLRVYQTI